MVRPLVSILIPHYKTRQLTKLCLYLLRKHTDLEKVQIIVIDNDSKDDSTEYLRSLSWIKLIERPSIPGESAVQAHARALDLAFDQIDTPYVLSIHTDTFMKNNNWLPFLLKYLEKDGQVAGVGSWKLEAKSFWRRCLKYIERISQLIFYRLIGKTRHPIEGKGKNYYYLRSHCALYKTDILRKHHLKFTDGDMVAGKYMHRALIELGYKMIFLPSDVLIHYMDHVNHATTILNPSLSRKKNVSKGLRRVQKNLKRFNADVILADTCWDC